jgi:hypothetical protein
VIIDQGFRKARAPIHGARAFLFGRRMRRPNRAREKRRDNTMQKAFILRAPSLILRQNFIRGANFC